MSRESGPGPYAAGLVERLFVRLHGLLFALLVWRHRDRRAEIEHTVAHLLSEAHERGGRMAMLRRAARELADLVRGAAAEQWRRDGSPRSDPRRPRPAIFRRSIAELAADLRYATRLYRRRPLLTGVLISSLAVGIAANGAIFTLFDSLLLRSSPILELDRLVAALALRDGDSFQVSVHDYLAWKERSRTLEAVGLAQLRGLNLATGEVARRLAGAAVTPDYLETLGVEPVAGRSFLPAEAEGARAAVALVSAELHRELFPREESGLGRTIELDGRRHTIVGVLPAGFDLPFGTDVWVPLSLDALDDGQRAARDYFLAARLAPGRSLETAQREIDALSLALAAERPATHRGWTAELLPLRRLLLGDLGDTLSGSLGMLQIAAAGLLLLTCANLSTLLLVRFGDRASELSVRRALGAERSRLVRQLVGEVLPIGLAGGLLGLLLARLALPLLVRLSPISAVALEDELLSVDVEPRVLLFVFGLAVASSLALSLPPALRAVLRARPSRRGGRTMIGGGRFLQGVVTVQVALAVALLVGAGLFVASYRNLRGQALGFEPEGVLVVRLTLPSPAYDDPRRRTALVERVTEGLRALPGVAVAGATTNVPLDHDSWDTAYAWRADRSADPDRLRLASYRAVTPGYLESLGVELVTGRLFEPRDVEAERSVAVVSADLAAEAWPDEPPVGKELRVGGAESGVWCEVIGVVAEIKEDRGAFRRSRPAVYLPYGEERAGRAPAFALRVPTDRAGRRPEAGDPAALAAAARRVVREVDPELPVHGVVTLDEQVRDVVRQERFAGLVTAVFALGGLLLAALGIFGVTSFVASRRRREIGLRIALGATPGRLLRSTFIPLLRRAFAGGVLGLAAAAAVASLLRRLLFGVSPLDVSLFGATLLGCTLVAVLAGLGPALRASRTSPVEALREE